MARRLKTSDKSLVNSTNIRTLYGVPVLKPGVCIGYLSWNQESVWGTCLETRTLYGVPVLKPGLCIGYLSWNQDSVWGTCLETRSLAACSPIPGKWRCSVSFSGRFNPAGYPKYFTLQYVQWEQKTLEF